MDEKEIPSEMSFKEVFDCLRQANEKIGEHDVDLEVWVGEKMYKIVRVGQFNFVPTVTLTLTEEPLMDLSKKNSYRGLHPIVL